MKFVRNIWAGNLSQRKTMKRDYGSVGTIALRASALLQAMSRDIEEQ
ncbi:hypothetical protein GYM32_005306, partial [Escherichia coli]|nr:hypothetical protein [Escherichia coli]